MSEGTLSLYLSWTVSSALKLQVELKAKMETVLKTDCTSSSLTSQLLDGDRRLATHPPPLVHPQQRLLVVGPLTLHRLKAALVFFLRCEVSLHILSARGLLAVAKLLLIMHEYVICLYIEHLKTHVIQSVRRMLESEVVHWPKWPRLEASAHYLRGIEVYK